MIKEQKSHVKNGLPPIHPGEMIADELEALAMSPAEFDAALSIPAGTTALLLDGCLDITPEFALRLGCYLGGSGESGAIWLRLQRTHDVKVLGCTRGKAIKSQVKPMAKAGGNSYFVWGR